ncbi:hypothetical protein ACTJLC_22385 [Paraburkholderia sp. 22099]|jgi:hypothetical protein|uniref:hypothetical protein n=1 Tax=Paraburkholderia TaxID=1822464 RepID=UPI0012B734B6|nr:hypothetical protein [Paraburkholderia terricola]MDR6493852.1 hypothetical protein [Paraburkholderia terricola]
MYVSLMARLAQSIGVRTQRGCSAFSVRLRPAFGRLDTGYPAVAIMCGSSGTTRNAFFPFLSSQASMIESFARVSGWQQLYHLWQLIVMLCQFLWALLRLLGGG